MPNSAADGATICSTMLPYSTLLAAAHAGQFDAMMVAFPCSTFSVSRLFDATKSGNADRGLPPVRSKAHPDGLPSDQLDAKHAKELGVANKLLDRTVEIIIAAYRSPRRTTFVLENPADRSILGTAQYASDMRDHGSLWATSPFQRLKDAISLSSTCTFAMCANSMVGLLKSTQLFGSQMMPLRY